MVRSLLARLPGGRPSGNECPARAPLGLWALFASVLFLAAVLAVPGRAESAGSAEELGSPADPPARVGRLAHVDGVVSFRAAGQDQWSVATLNYPVTSGDAVWTEPEAHAVVEIGPAVIRMGGGTELDAAQIDLHVAQLQLAQGSANIRLDLLPPGDSYVVVTPRGAITLLQPGLYRVDAGSADQPTRVIAFQGAAAFAGGGSSLSVEPGQAVEISGQDTLGYAVHPAADDDLDRWAAAQDAPPALAQAAPAQGATVQPVPGETNQYVSPEATGYRDLDHYGTWATTPDYGAVWYPTAVPAGWVPYRYGHWAWVAPWGWTWIDDAPWGFTPFHYGRWVFLGDRWAWVPGALVAEPVYAPALVTFIGGGGWSVAVADDVVPAIGWIPLAPEEVFIPFFHCSPTFIREVNITNVNQVVINRVINQNVIVNNNVVNNNVAITHFNPTSGAITFGNQQTVMANHHALTVVAHNDFVAARPVAKAALGVTPDVLKPAPVATASGPAALPRPAKTAAVAVHPAPQPQATAPLHIAAPASHGSAPAQAALHGGGGAPAATAPMTASGQAALPSAGTSPPRVMRGGAAAAPAPHPVPALVRAQPAPSPALQGHGAQAAAQPHAVQPVPQPHPGPGQPVTQLHPAPVGAQPRAIPSPMAPSHPAPARVPTQDMTRASPPQPHPVPQVTTLPPQPRTAPQQVAPNRSVPVPPAHLERAAPQVARVMPSAPALQPRPAPQIATPPPQPRTAPQQFAPNRSVSVPPVHMERAAPQVARVMPSAPALQPRPAPQIATLPPQPRTAPQQFAPNRSVSVPPAQVQRAAPQVAHMMPVAPAPQPRVAAPAARMAPPPSQGRPAPPQGHPSKQPHPGDQNN
jgi:uncharacterized protein DUF6600